ncbi:MULTISPECIES: aspartate carbamoyltransferase regulatory subunit [Methanobacterium]|jgi:aspartate carbamoyltransferase regulatory subunit|uniref:Aspartate carbamoyltransferase regulatory chain n=1 Tax=Methanobacterium subterraneum TaxID=59277 RepID=A0A2H4VPE6_9EURY|nr:MULTISPECIES: aspartate carbamoyltransferase regulatory subunit [Methanobacterium]MBW4257677.1 aspartate carbamoyltransferase regulatory subunit [Methanobacterium sp. YSL]AUB56156.1 aspartate carbamoyltransferase regulatory subunit [Methanobacterium subterraneum]AUB58972.1 aspartate carbamoyltransferase regulatory subunit [Methanobacterium sp. MZ-A1]AUB59974.1 aspartate carbamoyltransferase regulatory subunit [Methanobacterium subterraneum]MCC7560806.1 aspartate carbamoyltransferase regulat
MKTPWELKVKPIRNGTVIDHISANKALRVLKILGLPSKETAVTLAMNVQSSQMGSKDIVKIEGRELASREVDEIALIAPYATINIIRNYEIVGKGKVNLLNEINSILNCSNPNCITNTDEPVTTRFTVLQKEPLILRCHYCERIMDQTEVQTQFRVF